MRISAPKTRTLQAVRKSNSRHRHRRRFVPQTRNIPVATRSAPSPIWVGPRARAPTSATYASRTRNCRNASRARPKIHRRRSRTGKPVISNRRTRRPAAQARHHPIRHPRRRFYLRRNATRAMRSLPYSVFRYASKESSVMPLVSVSRWHAPKDRSGSMVSANRFAWKDKTVCLVFVLRIANLCMSVSLVSALRNAPMRLNGSMVSVFRGAPKGRGGKSISMATTAPVNNAPMGRCNPPRVAACLRHAQRELIWVTYPVDTVKSMDVLLTNLHVPQGRNSLVSFVN